MAKYRNIYCLIWSDDKFPFLSDDEQLVWLHLYTNSLTTGTGIYKASVEGLAADKRWDVERYRNAFDKLTQNMKVTYDKSFHVVCFPRFFDWNKPTNPKVLTSWVKTFEEIPDCHSKWQHLLLFREKASMRGKAYQKAFDIASEPFRDRLPQEQEQEQEQDKEQEQDSSAKKSPQKRGPQKTIFGNPGCESRTVFLDASCRCQKGNEVEVLHEHESEPGANSRDSGKSSPVGKRCRGRKLSRVVAGVPERGVEGSAVPPPGLPGGPGPKERGTGRAAAVGDLRVGKGRPGCKGKGRGAVGVGVQNLHSVAKENFWEFGEEA